MLYKNYIHIGIILIYYIREYILYIIYNVYSLREKTRERERERDKGALCSECTFELHTFLRF